MADLAAQTGPEPAPSESISPPKKRPAAYGPFVLVLFAAIGMLSVADRNVFSVLLVPMQKDLRVSDAAMGALTGLSFTVVYATVAFPMARLADRGNRRNIVAGALAVWSIMTAFCGVAGNYVWLLLARMGVAAGEASAYPAQFSMVGDLFPASRRGAAVGVLMIGTAIGVAFGAFIAGRLTDLYGWHAAFLTLGAPGLLLALIFFLTVREPLRGAHDGGDAFADESWRANVARLAHIRTLGPLLAAGVCINLVFSIFLAWLPAFLMRAEGMSASSMGAWFGLTSSPATFAVLVGGWASDRLAMGAPRRRLLLMAGLLAAAIPLFCTLLLTRNLSVVFAMMFVYAIVVGPVSAILPAAYLDVTPPRLRGTMTAASRFCADVLGAGLGPVVVGAINDLLKPTFGAEALRYSLISLPVMLVLSVLTLLWASRFADKDAQALRHPGEDEPLERRCDLT